jgi:hypothetical protein
MIAFLKNFVVFQVIRMLDDHGVSNDGVAVYEIAYQVCK